MNEYKKVVYICKITTLHKVAKLMKKCLLYFQSQKNLVQKTLSSILYYFSTLLVAMIGSCKTLVLYTFVKTWFKLRDYLFFPGNDQGVFHQIVSPILNSESTNFFHEFLFHASHYDFFFNWQAEKKLSLKTCFGPIGSLFSFSTAQTEKILWKNS